MISLEDVKKDGTIEGYPVGSICLKCMSVKIGSQFTTDLELEESHWQDIKKFITGD